MTEAELEAENKEVLIARIAALQNYIVSLNKSTEALKEKKTAANPDHSLSTMTPEQLDAKVETARRLMVSRIKSQMKVLIPIAPSLDFTDNSRIVEAILQN